MVLGGVTGNMDLLLVHPVILTVAFNEEISWDIIISGYYNIGKISQSIKLLIRFWPFTTKLK